jgi:hypothetical protein
VNGLSVSAAGAGRECASAAPSRRLRATQRMAQLPALLVVVTLASASTPEKPPATPQQADAALEIHSHGETGFNMNGRRVRVAGAGRQYAPAALIGRLWAAPQFQRQVA